MDYCTIADVVSAATEELLIQLTDDAGTGTYDPVVVQAEIDNGKAEMDPYLRVRHSEKMPFANVPGILKLINVDIAIYRIHKRRGGIPDSWNKAYDTGMKKLEGISKGTINLGTDAGGKVTIDNDSVTFTSKTPEDRIFRAPDGY